MQDQGHISYSRPFCAPFCIKFSVFDLVKNFTWLSNNPSGHPKKAGVQEQVKIQKKKYKNDKYGKKSQNRVTQILKQQLVTYVMDRKSMFWSVFFLKAIHVHNSFMQKFWPLWPLPIYCPKMTICQNYLMTSEIRKKWEIHFKKKFGRLPADRTWWNFYCNKGTYPASSMPNFSFPDHCLVWFL